LKDTKEPPSYFQNITNIFLLFLYEVLLDKQVDASFFLKKHLADEKIIEYFYFLTFNK
jgi:hypothetical protein